MFANLFADSVKKNYEEQLVVNGKIPTWLQGDLFRIGPGKYRAGVCSLLHWFDGFSHIVRFNFSKGKVRYKNAFLQTAALRQSLEKKRNAGFMFASVPTTLKYYAHSFINLFRALLFLPTRLPNYYDNCNVNIMPSEKGNLLALTEVTKYVEFDRNINTLGEYHYKDVVEGVTTTAHPTIQNKTVYNVLQSYSLISKMKVVRHDINSSKRTVITSLWRFFPAYFHTFFSSKNYIVLVEPPLRLLFPLLVVLVPFVSFLQLFFWVPFFGTNITVIEKSTGDVKLTKRVKSFFFFHATNAYEKKDGTLIIELPLLKNPELMQRHFYLDNIRKNLKINSSSARYTQFAIDLNNKTVIEKDIANNFFIELQSVVDEKKFSNHNYVYGIGNNFMFPATDANKGKASKGKNFRGKIAKKSLSTSTSTNVNAESDFYLENFFQKLLKLNVAKSEVATFCDEDCYYGEPILVKPLKKKTRNTAKTSSTEDEGVLLSLCYSNITKRSSLVGVDAKTMKKVFEAFLPHVVPLGFHGQFVADKNAA